MGEYTLTPEQEASVKTISWFKSHAPIFEGPEFVNGLLKILYDLTDKTLASQADSPAQPPEGTSYAMIIAAPGDVARCILAGQSLEPQSLGKVSWEDPEMPGFRYRVEFLFTSKENAQTMSHWRPVTISQAQASDPGPAVSPLALPRNEKPQRQAPGNRNQKFEDEAAADMHRYLENESQAQQPEVE